MLENLGDQESYIGKVINYFKIAFYLILAGLKILFWPFLMLVKRFESSWKSATASSLEKIGMKERTSEDLVLSGRAQIIEVSIEASFQPLLVLYILLLILLTFNQLDRHDASTFIHHFS